jgi:hypothetical protein
MKKGSRMAACTWAQLGSNRTEGIRNDPVDHFPEETECSGGFDPSL